MFKVKVIELKYKYDYSDEPVKKYKMNENELDKYLRKYDNSQQIIQLKASPLYKLGLRGLL